MLSRDRYEYGKLFRHVILISLTVIFFTNLVLLILSLYYYEGIISIPGFITTKHDGAVLFLYLVTAPIVTIIHTSIQLLLSNHNLYLTPRAIVASYAVYLISAGIAWWKERKAEKCDNRELGVELESL